MKSIASLLLAGSLSSLAASVASAANLDGTGYIYVTKPTTAWTPPSNVTNTPRFLWYPDKAAFRFGDLSTGYSNLWNDYYIGAYSFAGGKNSLASGDCSFAFGLNSYASDASAIAMGEFADANQAYSVAIGGYSTAGGYGSTALGFNSVADGDWSSSFAGGNAFGASAVAIGPDANASGNYSFSIGTGDPSYAGGDLSFAIGMWTYSLGSESLALGDYSQAIADYSYAIGNGAYTTSQGSVALGSGTVSNRRNGTAASPSSPQSDDPVLMVGPVSQNRNALTIYRNGDSHFNGVVRVWPGGDIPMGSYQSKPAGVQYP